MIDIWRLGTMSAVIGIGIGLAACQTGAGTTASASATTPSAQPTTSAASVPGEPVGDRLAEVMTNTSLSGQNIAGESFCNYYGANGSLLRTASGVRETGTWSVDGRFVCEMVNGVSGCMTLDFLPLGGVTVTLADGSGGFSYPAQSTSGNSCG